MKNKIAKMIFKMYHGRDVDLSENKDIIQFQMILDDLSYITENLDRYNKNGFYEN